MRTFKIKIAGFWVQNLPRMEISFTLLRIMLKNGQTQFKNSTVLTLQDFKSMFGQSFNIMHENVNTIQWRL